MPVPPRLKPGDTFSAELGAATAQPPPQTPGAAEGAEGGEGRARQGSAPRTGGGGGSGSVRGLGERAAHAVGGEQNPSASLLYASS